MATVEGKYDHAIKILKDAIKLLPPSGGPSTRDDAWISLARTYSAAGRVQKSIDTLEHLADTYSTNSFPEGRRIATLQNLALSYSRIGRLQEARMKLSEIQRLVTREDNELNLLRVKWAEAELSKAEVEARIYRIEGGGRAHQGLVASKRFQEVRAEFLRRGLLVDASLAGLSLAELHLELEDSPAAISLAAQLIPVFRSKRLHKEASVAELIIAQAV